MVSVVIPAYNEEKTMTKTLESLARQKTGISFEVIVVDNNSIDKTKKIAGNFKKKLNIKVIKEKRQGRGAARAAGFAEAIGEIILSTDADTVVPPNWIENMVKYFDNRKTVAVTGPWRISRGKKLTKFFVNNFQRLSILCLTGLNFGIRTGIYKKAGGFDRSLKAHEDIALTFKVAKLGKIKYAGDIVVRTSGRRYKKGVLNGLWSYQKTAFNYFVLKDKSKNLGDRR
ncbi:hypothetical protein A2627_05205 [Candidatus Woesebacteria bacterium RIFCSPHIGHO2_01_FULL_39_28]|uniref:Glycosyltransferase 2-like domain-containing protein n=1 Tax=Candidatus Woesebacteria bacterium RIFCSPHIGHO2_01_FULL_39_28 TaxID=1802496 RepID=A0A1F7YB43_9BACT|nr:MAG: hypothetical protein A2627_05205 [Candidatus Woesebacteria bacterium RIFCSPHIGHO2_01_FULL_39_28]